GPDGFLWCEGDRGIATAGVAATVPVSEAEGVLREIRHDDDHGVPGRGAIAVGALPFADGESAWLTIPARVVGRDAEGRGWITHVGPVLEAAPAPTPRPTRFVVRAEQSRAW